MVSVSRQWNTWDQRDPLSMVHLPTGLCLRFSVFSNKEGVYRQLGAETDVTLQQHMSDGSFVRATARHADSELEITFAKTAPHAVLAVLRTTRCSEWGLRYWVALEVGFLELGAGPAPWRPEEPWIEVVNPEPLPPERPPALFGRHRSLWVSVVSETPAVFGGAYQSIETFQADMNARGYYASPRQEAAARWGVLRFNAQMHPDIVIAAAFGTDREAAARNATSLLPSARHEVAGLRARADADADASRAVRDVISWNTVWDTRNHRATTVLTRNWLGRKFSGWGVWLDDMLFHGMLAALVSDWETARANIDAALEYLCPDGNLPCLRTATQEWVDRSQSPIAAFVVWRIYTLSGDRTLLAQHYPTLLRAHRWWIETRDPNHDGLIAFGSTATGAGAFVHTKQAAMDESLMDNAPIFDDATFDETSHCLTMAEPGLTSLVSLDAQFLARIARVLGDAAAAAELETEAARLNEAVRERLWDEARGTFAGRHWDGRFVEALSPTCLYPLLAGAATAAQVARIIETQLLDPAVFWGARVLPSSPHAHPASVDNVYWRGRIWPPHLFLVWEGLRRQNRLDLARDLADRAWAMFRSGWDTRRQCRENFHRSDAAGDDSPDSDPFYTWGALIPAMKVLGNQPSPWDAGADG